MSIVQWQPMDTAPDDGQAILLIERRSRGDFVCIGSFDNGEWWGAENDRWIIASGWLPMPGTDLIDQYSQRR